MDSFWFILGAPLAPSGTFFEVQWLFLALHGLMSEPQGGILEPRGSILEPQGDMLEPRDDILEHRNEKVTHLIWGLVTHKVTHLLFARRALLNPCTRSIFHNQCNSMGHCGVDLLEVCFFFQQASST